MLARLTKAARRKAAGLLVLLYAGCVIMPAAAFAFDGGTRAAHCLTDAGPAHVHQHEHSKPHVHDDGTTHHHDGAAAHQQNTSDGDEGTATCCGLFCVTAMAANAGAALGIPTHHSSVFAVSFEELAGRGPDRINKPPISLLPL
jgi:hypothetical protein